MTLETSSNLEPDPAVVSRQIFRCAMLAAAQAFDAVRGGAYSRKLIQLNDSASEFPTAWVQYSRDRNSEKKGRRERRPS
jgi:hypothetical protein